MPQRAVSQPLSSLRPNTPITPNLTDILFNTAWRTLSHAAVPAMLKKEDLDENGLIRRDFCPEVYDEVVSTLFPYPLSHHFFHFPLPQSFVAPRLSL
jgi:hypothetical protein